MIGIFLALALQLQIPDPTGYVNDFAGVLDPATERRMTAVIEEVRAKSGGEIAVVTLADLGGRSPMQVARDIGRQWGVGARGGPGDAARNAGVVLLLKPGNRPGDGRADVFISTGTGAEGFITDARAGRIRDAIGRASVESGSYAEGLVVGVWLLGQAYAEEFDFELTGERPRRAPESVPSGGIGGLWFVLFLFFILPMILRAVSGRARMSRIRGGHHGHSGSAKWILLGMLLGGGGRGGGWGSGGGGGGFGGGGAGGSF